MLALQILTALLLAIGTVLLLAFLRSVDLASEPVARPLPAPKRVAPTPEPASEWLRPAA